MKAIALAVITFLGCSEPDPTENAPTYTGHADEAPYDIHALADRIWQYYGMWGVSPTPHVYLVTGEDLNCDLPYAVDSWLFATVAADGQTYRCVTGLTYGDIVYIGYSGRPAYQTALAHELWHARSYARGQGGDGSHVSSGFQPAGAVDCANFHLQYGWETDPGQDCGITEQNMDCYLFRHTAVCSK